MNKDILNITTNIDTYKITLDYHIGLQMKNNIFPIFVLFPHASFKGL